METTQVEKIEITEDRLIARGNRVLLRKLDGDSKTKSGLIIPDSAKNNTPMRIGEVIKVGPLVNAGLELKDFLKEGDLVGFQEGAGTPLEFEKKESKLHIIREVDLIVKIEK